MKKIFLIALLAPLLTFSLESKAARNNSVGSLGSLYHCGQN